MLDSIYHIALKLLKNHIFGVKTSRFMLSFMQLYNRCHYIALLNLLNHWLFIDFIAWHFVTLRCEHM